VNEANNVTAVATEAVATGAEAKTSPVSAGSASAWVYEGCIQWWATTFPLLLLDATSLQYACFESAPCFLKIYLILFSWPWVAPP